ncbi:FtsX-like permease family protein [Actinophytocola sp.]|uniref:FtsX-like permease family protein n=1 Tax=Actinophytocola sp. TaxID=1872138 RepID=UPI002ED0F4AB
MIKLALASLRYRTAAAIATFLAVMLGSAILIACGGLFESGLRLDSLPQRFAGAPVVLGGPEPEVGGYGERSGIGADVVGEVAAVDGVERAVADVSFPAVLVADPRPTDGGAYLAGHDWTSASLTPYTVRGDEPGAGEVVLDAVSAEHAGVKPGDRVEIVVAGEPESFVVSGVATARHQVDAPALFFAEDDVRRFSAHPDTVDAIGVFPAAGTSADDLAERLAARFGDLTVFTGDDRGTVEFAGIGTSFFPLILLSSIFGGMVMVVMGIVVAATIGLTVRQRERELALLRASGATPAQVRKMVLAETMVVAGLAVLCGLALGRFMGLWLFALITDRGVVPAKLEFQQGPVPFAAGIVLGLAAPYLAARLAARRAADTRPIQALVEAAIPPAEVGMVRRYLARVFAAATVGLAVTTPFLGAETAAATGGPAVLTGAIAVALLGPEIIDRLVGRAAGLIRRVGGTNGHLAVINTRTRAVQFAAVLMPITLGTAIALGNVYSQTTESAAREAGYAQQLQADAVVTSTFGAVTPGMLADVLGTPGVADASALVSSSGAIEQPEDTFHGEEGWPLLGVDAQERDPVIAMPVTAGSLADLDGNTVAVPRDAAEDLGFGVGDEISVRLGDGVLVDVRVVALLDSPWNYPSLVLPAGLLAPHTTAELPSQILVRAESGQDPAALVGTLRERVAGWPGTEVGGEDALLANFSSGLGMQAWINYLLAFLAIAYAAIATINTLAVSVLARRREFGVQRLNGATRRQVMRMLFLEGSVIATAGIALGAVVSLFTVIPMAIAVSHTVVPSGPVWVFLAVVLAAYLLVLPVTYIASRLAMKHTAAEAVSLPDA